LLKKKKIKENYKKKHTSDIIKNKKIHEYIGYYYKGKFHKIYKNLCNRIYETFTDKNIKSELKYSELIGCTIEELEVHITNKFVDNMTIDNYGEWEIDHIIPISSFDLTKKENQILCFNYKNLQPLWAEDNLKKSNKIFTNI